MFNLHKQLPIVAMTAGIGHLGSASNSNVAKDLRILLTRDEKHKLNTNSYTIQEVADKANGFLSERYSEIDPPPASPHSFEFWIGGYGSGEVTGEIWKLEIVDGNIHSPIILATAKNEDMLLWGGQTTAISRLICGFDAQMQGSLSQLGISDKDILNLRNKHQTPLVHSTMPVQDAIDLADFLVDLAKGYSAFLPGANVVGGDTDIATVTKHEGFKWIRRKHYYPAHLNPKETDHVK